MYDISKRMTSFDRLLNDVIEPFERENDSRKGEKKSSINLKFGSELPRRNYLLCLHTSGF